MVESLLREKVVILTAGVSFRPTHCAIIVQQCQKVSMNFTDLVLKLFHFYMAWAEVFKVDIFLAMQHRLRKII
jgi:hypothetical protein